MASKQQDDGTGTELVLRSLRFEDVIHIHMLEQEYFADNFKLAHSFINFVYDSGFSFVCEWRGRIVGVIRAEECRGEVFVETLCVEQAFSNRGVGRMLLERCLESIRAHEKTARIMLMVSENNRVAKRLYEDVGFEVQRYERNAYFDGSGGLVMVFRDRAT